MAPNIHAMVVTPICAHSLNKRSLVLDGSDRITLEIGQTKDVTKDLAVLIADGRNVGDLQSGTKSRYQDHQVIRNGFLRKNA